MDTATEIEIDAAKTASKRVVQETAEAAGNLIGDEMAKTKSKEDETNKRQEIYIPTEKKQKIVDNIGSFQNKSIKVEYQKIINLLDTIPD